MSSSFVGLIRDILKQVEADHDQLMIEIILLLIVMFDGGKKCCLVLFTGLDVTCLHTSTHDRALSIVPFDRKIIQFGIERFIKDNGMTVHLSWRTFIYVPFVHSQILSAFVWYITQISSLSEIMIYLPPMKCLCPSYKSMIEFENKQLIV